MKFIIIAAIASIFFVILDLLCKFTNCSKLNVDHFVSLWHIFGGIIAFTYFTTNGLYNSNVSNNTLLIIILTAALTFFGNIIYFNSAKVSFNPGLSRAIFSGTHVGLVTLISLLLFNKYLSIYQILGVIFIIMGIGLIFLNS